MSFIKKIYNRWMKLRLQPIRVYCLHHVCEHFDPESMNEGDWMALNVFTQKVLAMRHSGVKFISLTDAHDKLAHSLSPFAFRLNRYAVLTFDDGYASLREILPWLNEMKIPATLFINPDYAAGKSYRTTPKEQYLTIEELHSICGCPMGETNGRGWVEIGIHGLQHLDVSKMSEMEFQTFVEESIEKTKSIASRLSPLAYIPFWAYTWGRHNATTDKILRMNNIIPVLIDEMNNYNEINKIHRVLLK